MVEAGRNLPAKDLNPPTHFSMEVIRQPKILIPRVEDMNHFDITVQKEDATPYNTDFQGLVDQDMQLEGRVFWKRFTVHNIVNFYTKHLDFDIIRPEMPLFAMQIPFQAIPMISGMRPKTYESRQTPVLS